MDIMNLSLNAAMELAIARMIVVFTVCALWTAVLLPVLWAAAGILRRVR